MIGWIGSIDWWQLFTLGGPAILAACMLYAVIGLIIDHVRWQHDEADNRATGAGATDEWATALAADRELGNTGAVDMSALFTMLDEAEYRDAFDTIERQLAAGLAMVHTAALVALRVPVPVGNVAGRS
jgi:hypothetical protein